MKRLPTVFVLSGPSAVGKTTVWEAYRKRYAMSMIEKIVTTTSRDRRPGETEGEHYYFWTAERFQEAIRENLLIEYAVVHGKYYGSTYAELERIVADRKSPLYIVDPQGMIHIKPLLEARWYAVKTVFLLPPSLGELKARLIGRWLNSPDDLELRYANALVEMEEEPLYDVSIVNRDIEQTLETLHSIFNHGEDEI